jgi:hypothetical protein
MTYQIDNLHDLLSALQAEGLISYDDCGSWINSTCTPSHLKVTFDKHTVSSWDGEPIPVYQKSIRFFDHDGGQLEIIVEPATCGSYSDVSFGPTED